MGGKHISIFFNTVCLKNLYYISINVYVYIISIEFHKKIHDLNIYSYIYLIFKNFRPDVGYIQGMSYSVVFLLLSVEPQKAFQIFSTLIFSVEILYKCFTFDKELVSNLNKATKNLIKKYFPNLYGYFSKKKIDIWQIYIIEVKQIIFKIY